ncbi:unnamed protein product, partial [Heterosigma akashiwo]
ASGRTSGAPATGAGASPERVGRRGRPDPRREGSDGVRIYGPLPTAAVPRLAVAQLPG